MTSQQQNTVAGKVPTKKRNPIFEDDNGAANQNVVIRWKDSEPTNQASYSGQQQVSAAAVNAPASRTGMSYGQVFDGRQQAVQPASGLRSATSSNPLRNQTYSSRNTAGTAYRSAPVQQAAYQQGGNQPFDPFGDDPGVGQGFPDLPDLQQGGNQGNAFPSQPQNDGLPMQPQNNAGNDPAAGFPPAEIQGANDPLSLPESAPNPLQDQGPGNILEGNSDTNPFPGASQEPEAPSSSDQYSFDDEENGLELPDQADRQRNSLSCNELRDRFLSRPLTVVQLNVSPKFGVGLRGVREDTTDELQKFADESKLRDWHNNAGDLVASGRLIDLKNDRVILDVYGKNREIPLRDLSDYDLAYVGEAWNIPLKCGTGNASYEGRSHMHSVVQWKAPGHCHKPLYFEQPQLERYGHTVGPVLQPLISSAHFFTNISILPYKMGIHPPNECQYSLGYYRPGNCAPYMVQPFPWSLRGAAVQAGAVTGIGGLIP